jgi:hypothetical protein
VAARFCELYGIDQKVRVVHREQVRLLILQVDADPIPLAGELCKIAVRIGRPAAIETELAKCGIECSAMVFVRSPDRTVRASRPRGDLPFHIGFIEVQASSTQQSRAAFYDLITIEYSYGF